MSCPDNSKANLATVVEAYRVYSGQPPQLVRVMLDDGTEEMCVLYTNDQPVQGTCRIE